MALPTTFRPFWVASTLSYVALSRTTLGVGDLVPGPHAGPDSIST